MDWRSNPNLARTFADWEQDVPHVLEGCWTAPTPAPVMFADHANSDMTRPLDERMVVSLRRRAKIAEMLAAGVKVGDMALALRISTYAVRYHIKAITDRASVSSTVERNLAGAGVTPALPPAPLSEASR